MRRGFTLVELSIVLVIIGLLAGGILVAKSIIETVRTQNFIRAIQQYDIAIENFTTSFKALPGDSPLSGGNGDGKIADPGYDYSFTSEVSNFWPDLGLTGFMPNTTLSATINGNFSTKGSTINAPAIKNDGTAGIIYSSVDGTTGNIYHFLSFAKWENLTASTTYVWHPNVGLPAFTPPEAFAIDKKIDDGLSNIGNVQSRMSGAPSSSQIFNMGGSGIYTECDNALDYPPKSPDARYLIQNQSRSCYLGIGIRGQVLDPAEWSGA